MKCPYGMGHREMNWEVRRPDPEAIARRSRLLGGEDWSSFPVAEQRAYAFAREPASAPGTLSDADHADLDRYPGADLARLVILNTSPYRYMKRISNGLQLTLERENVFHDCYNTRRPPESTGPA